MDEVEGGIDNMSRGYNYYGAHVESDNTFVMRQWAPSAQVIPDKCFDEMTKHIIF